MNNTFRRRSESALIHPATLAAVALLLVNDLLFKALWPGAWAPGKLSDLAWMIFAPPLLVFLLSFLTRRNTAGQRVAFLSAYVGLPLLYAAFNSFGPVHDVILRGLSLISGGTAGSPLDPTDSLVIPLGLGTAAWVWRRPPVASEVLRLRWGLLVAGVAALASVASSNVPPLDGITEVGTSENGAVLVSAYFGNFYVGSYRTDDGGVSWTGVSGFQYDRTSRIGSADTPVGTFKIDGPDIILIRPDGREELAYSTDFLQQGGNLWVQERATASLGARTIATEPYGIVYDDRSGNLIAAMGIQGVLVGTPDGRWTRAAVAQFVPTNDFSFSIKTRQLVSNISFLASMFALALAMTVSALVASQYSRGDSPLRRNISELLTAISALMAIGLILVFPGSDAETGTNYDVLEFVFGIPAFTLGAAAMVTVRQQLRHWQEVVPAFLGMNVLVVLPFMLWLHLGIALGLAKLSALVLTVLAAVALTSYLKRLRQLP